jgi:spermidine/putrescine transport system substrate-binding protein
MVAMKGKSNERKVRRMLSRRDLNRLLAGAGLAIAELPITNRRAAAEDQATYLTWSGYDDPEFFPAYVAKYGASPNTPLFSDPEDGFLKLRAGFFADVVHPCSDRIQRWRDAGLLQPIDVSRLSHWADVVPVLKTITPAADGSNHWFIPIDWGNTSILYRADLVDVKEESWRLLWDGRYKGRLAMGEDVTDTAVICALIAGVADPYDMTDEDIARVRELLTRQKPLLRFYWSDPTVLEQAVASGEVVAAPAWNSSITALKAQGVDVKYMNPKEGRLTWCCGLVLTSQAREIEKAYDLMNAMLSPEAGEWLINYGYGHSNLRSFARVSADVLADRGLSKNVEEHLRSGVYSRENRRLDDLQQMFEAVKAGA